MNIKLKAEQKIRIIRDRLGAMDSNSRSDFETTVAEAIKCNDFTTSHGTMRVRGELIDHKNPAYNGSPIYTNGRGAVARVREDWEIEMENEN